MTSKLTAIGRGLTRLNNYPIGKAARAIPYYQGDPNYRHPLEQPNDVHAACRPLLRMLEGIANDRSLAASLGEQLRLGNQIGQVNSQLEIIRGAYDTSLLETIAQQNSVNNEVTELKVRVRDLTAKLNQLSKAQRDVAQRIVQTPAIAQLLNLIGAPSADDAAELKAELKMLRYWRNSCTEE